jgi:hypothetical protein
MDTADQHEIWGDISDISSRMGVNSPSKEMGAVFEEKTAEIKNYTKKFQAAANQVGAIFAINGEIVGLDSFGKSDTYRKLHSKLVESYALDAIDRKAQETTTISSTESVVAFVDAIRNSFTESNQAVSLGKDVRISSPDLNGFALIFEDDLVHLSAFAQENEAKIRQHSKMNRFSSRRMNRNR